MAKLSKEEKRWRAEEDAYTLIRAQEIEEDRVRKAAAVKQLKDKAKEAEKAVKKVTKLIKKGQKKK